MAYISVEMDLQSVARRVSECGSDEVAEFIDSLAKEADGRLQVRVSRGDIELQPSTVEWLRSLVKAADDASSST